LLKKISTNATLSRNKYSSYHIKMTEANQESISTQELSPENLLAAYIKINSGYRRKAVFVLSNLRGFGSNLIDMVLAMLYCLTHKLEFQIDSSNWLPGKEEAYQKHFVSCCKELDHSRCWMKPGELYYTKYALLWKLQNPSVVFLNHVLALRMNREIDTEGTKMQNAFLRLRGLWRSWEEKRDEEFLPEHFLFPELGINGNLFHAASVIMRMILQPTAKTFNDNYGVVESLKPYIAMHFRGGDKSGNRSKEVRAFQEPKEYVQKLQEIAPDIKNVLIASDDYRAVLALRELRPDLNIVTFCDKEKEGYFQEELKLMIGDHQEEALAEFIIDLFYMRHADYFIGVSSNVSQVVFLLKEKKNCWNINYQFNRYTPEILQKL